MTPSKQTLLNTRAILDILQSENREGRLENFARSMELCFGRLERLENKYKKREKKIKKITS